MDLRKVKINLEYIKPNNSFIYPLYTEDGVKVLESRTILTAEKIKEIIEQYGKYVYYTDPGDKAVIPSYRMESAVNKSKAIMDEIASTDKLSKTTFKEAELIIEDIISDIDSQKVIILNLLRELKSHDEYIYNHSVNTGILSAYFAKSRSIFSQEEVKSIAFGSFLHDIGSVKIDRQLLNKEGKLNITEIQKMKRHPQLGYEILKNIDSVNPIVLQSVLFHHEKYNGNGYYSLPYEALPEYPKIVSISDIYDALITKRPYREELQPEMALKAIVNTINLHFDYDLVSEFINKVAPVLNHSYMFYTIHDICELESQELALIKDYGENDLLKPKVLVFCKFMRKGNSINVKFYDNPLSIDLKNDMQRKIVKIITNEEQLNTIRKNLKSRSII